MPPVGILCHYISLMLDYHIVCLNQLQSLHTGFWGNFENRHIQKFEVTNDLGKGSNSIVHSVQLQNTSGVN